MNGNYLFDTNILIDILQRVSNKNYIKSNFDRKSLYISIINKIELMSYQNILNQEILEIEDLLKSFKILPLNDEIEASTLIRRNKSLKLPDAIIAASALFVGATLLTNDDNFNKLKWPKLDVQSLRY
jgi:predicted nucleic acid-binding protein